MKLVINERMRNLILNHISNEWDMQLEKNLRSRLKEIYR